jgi:hypothetical protein
MAEFQCTYSFGKANKVQKKVSGTTLAQVFHEACVEADKFGERCTGVMVERLTPKQ